MAIDKSLYTAPSGEVDPVELEEIEIEMPEMVENEDGSVEVMLVGGTDTEEDIPFDANLAEYLKDTQLASIASDLMEMVDDDIRSRSDWVDTYVEGLKILGLNYEERTEPWDGACGVSSTVLSEAVIRFQAETMAEVFPAAGPVRTKILGKETKAKEEAAARVKADMNHQLTDVMTEYRTEHEKMLWALALSGSAFKKVYFDTKLDRQVAPFINAEDIIVPYGATVIEHAERVTHVMRKTENEVAALQANGFYADIELSEPEAYHSDIEEKKAEDEGFTLNEDNRYYLYEIHVDAVLEGTNDGDLAKPYIVTIERGSNDVLGIRRNWVENDELGLKRQHFVHYTYIPGFGFYGMGLINIIGGYARAGTSLIRQLVDAGTLSNLPGGLKSRDLRQKGEDGPIKPGEWRDVDVPSGSIKDHLIPLPYGEPSQTLVGLLDKITTDGRRLGAIADMDISDMSANAPVGTTLALLERQLKPMAAIHARIHYAMKQEFILLKDIISENSPLDEYEYEPTTGELRARQADYALVAVIPVSDPNSSTMAQRVVQYQAVLQMSETAPDIYDLPQLHRQMIEVIGVKNADKLVPASEDVTPKDPISENMGALTGTGMKSFLYQDHDAHISAHMSFMQDPMIAQLIGQNPKAQQIMASLQAHVAEHLGFSYRMKIEEKLGVTLPPPNEELPEEVEVMLSRAVADAAKQLTAQNQKQEAQKKAQAQEEDPALQIERESEKTKRMEVERKAKKDGEDIGLRRDEQQRKRAKDVVDAELKLEEVAQARRATTVEAKRADAELENERTELDSRTSIETLKALLGAGNNTGGKPPSE